MRPDVILATETWLDPSVTNSQILPSCFNVYRKDRENRTGGGVLIAIHNKFLSSEMPDLDTDAEIIWASIQQQGNKELRLCAYYHPKTSDELTAFERSIQSACRYNSQILIGGDFNLPGWNWKDKSLKPGTQHPTNHYHLTEILDDHGLTQMVEVPTRNNSILDLFITNMPNNVQKVDTTPGIPSWKKVMARLAPRKVNFLMTRKKNKKNLQLS